MRAEWWEDLLISTNSLCCYDTWPGGHEDDIWRAEERDESSDWGKRGDKVKLWNKAISEIFQTSFWPERSGLRPSRLDLGQPSTSSTPRPINTSIKDTCSENLKKKTAWEICNLLQKFVISFCHYHSDENSHSSKYYRTVYIEENTIGICWGDATPPFCQHFESNNLSHWTFLKDLDLAFTVLFAMAARQFSSLSELSETMMVDFNICVYDIKAIISTLLQQKRHHRSIHRWYHWLPWALRACLPDQTIGPK